MTKRIFVTTSVLFLFTSGMSVTAAEKAMTGPELQQLLANGKTLKLGSKELGYAGELVLSADGTGKGSVKTLDGKKTFVLDGTWKITGNKFCRTWTEIDKGKEVCETWVKDGDNKVNAMKGKKKIGVNSW